MRWKLPIVSVLTTLADNAERGLSSVAGSGHYNGIIATIRPCMDIAVAVSTTSPPYK